MPLSMAALTCASLSGAAVAMEASAVATAPARTAELIVDLVDMLLPLVGWSARRSSSARWSVRSGRPMCYIYRATQIRDRQVPSLENNSTGLVTKDRSRPYLGGRQGFGGQGRTRTCTANAGRDCRR